MRVVTLNKDLIHRLKSIKKKQYHSIKAVSTGKHRLEYQPLPRVSESALWERRLDSRERLKSSPRKHCSKTFEIQVLLQKRYSYNHLVKHPKRHHRKVLLSSCYLNDKQRLAPSCPA